MNEIFKITPIEKPPTKHNNFIKKSSDIIHHLKYLIRVQVFLGISRLYLFKCSKLLSGFSYLYSLVLIVLSTFVVFENQYHSASYFVIKGTACIEFILLAFSCLFMQKKKLEKFFEHLTNFDELLNINKHLNVTSSIYRGVLWIIGSLVYSIVEHVLLVIYVYSSDISSPILYLTMLAHDSEQVFFCTLLRTILMRVRIVKAHVAKVFHVDENVSNKRASLNKVEALSNNVQLDISSLHKIYELLHECAEELNSIMSFPMMIMLFSSGLSTTILLKNIFRLIQTTDEDNFPMRSIIIYASVRCVKYTVFVIIPCYYSSTTTAQVSIIRTMLHDAVNSTKLDKIERRKVKAFFQLTRDNEFAYALWGVIRLNMSLPLSYSSLCTTYLVIIIQFSKFID